VRVYREDWPELGFVPFNSHKLLYFQGACAIGSPASGG
jgi:hypothetical protein